MEAVEILEYRQFPLPAGDLEGRRAKCGSGQDSENEETQLRERGKARHAVEVSPPATRSQVRGGVARRELGIDARRSGPQIRPVNSAFAIRTARPEDAPTIADFNQRLAWETEHRQLEPAVIRAGVEAVLRDPAKGVYFVAEAEGRVIGQCSVTYEWSDWRNGNLWWFQSVYVEAGWRAKGVFRALFEHVRRSAVAAGVVGLRLYVEGDNAAAQAVYTRQGMARTGYQVFECELPR